MVISTTKPCPVCVRFLAGFGDAASLVDCDCTGQGAAMSGRSRLIRAAKYVESRFPSAER